MVKRLPRNWVDLRREWGGLSAYERFEAFVGFKATPASVAALAGLVLCLGVTYWLMQERDSRITRAPGDLPSGPRPPGDRQVA